jgi:hypothetical protein
MSTSTITNRWRIAAGITLVIAASASVARAQEVPLLRAMQEEMTRAMAGLRVKDQPPPYYIAYTVTDAASARMQATLGSLLMYQTQRLKVVWVEVRVGDHALDSSRFLTFDRDAGIGSRLSMGVITGPLDDDLDVIRRQLWLTTDAAYKRALHVFAKKKAAFQNRVDDDPVPDFSRETAHQRVLPTPAAAIEIGEWPARVRELSSVFLSHPDIASSNVTLTTVQGSRYFLNSEGFKTVSPLQSASLQVIAETQADDGMRLRDFRAAYARTLDQLPAIAELTSDTRSLATGLMALRSAPLGSDYSGPVLVQGQAASELLAQRFVPLFLSFRMPESEDQQMMMVGPMSRLQTSPFLTRLGARALPELLTVRDTPSLQRYENRPVPGAYAIDDEGVAAQDVTLCEKGTIATLLTSRTPQKGLLTSNGHNRGGKAQAGVFQVEPTAGVPFDQLRQRFLARLKQEGRPFGYVIRALASPSVRGALYGDDIMAMRMADAGPANGPDILVAMRVTPDGKEELVRGVRLGPVSHTTFKELADASTERTLYNYRPLPDVLSFMRISGGGGFSDADVTVSLIAPNLLFGELEVQKQTDVHRSVPLVPSPLK